MAGFTGVQTVQNSQWSTAGIQYAQVVQYNYQIGVLVGTRNSNFKNGVLQWSTTTGVQPPPPITQIPAQSTGSGMPGTSGAEVDSKLLAQTKAIAQELDSWANLLAAKGDSRAFFTYAHSYIANKIVENIALFNNPNSLMQLLDSFATVYLNALRGAPTPEWQGAFKWCGAMNSFGRLDDPISALVLSVYTKFPWEQCAMKMAYVHINVDLRNALMQVKGVDPQDYGNVLKFVEMGEAFAEQQLIGRTIGNRRFAVILAFQSLWDMSVKNWRNQVFKDVYKENVPDPSAEFVAQSR
jgi:hypothetical protein